MDPGEYDLDFFHRQGFARRSCTACGSAFWSLGPHTRCQESPCTPYGFIGAPGFSRARTLSEMRETYLSFFERHGHERVRRYPVIARWRSDVFFVQASIYDFQPWVTSGEILPPANPLTISQPCVRFVDLEEVGRSGRHFTEFEMLAHHAFNRPDHTVYFKDRTVELCHELLTSELGADPRAITYKEEEWEGGGNLGPSLSVGLLGVELATLVFMEYVRDGSAIRPMPLTVVDTGYGLERFTWMGQGTRTAYEAVFGPLLGELVPQAAPETAAMLLDHARTVNFLITDGIVPSNSQEGYYARLLVRRMLRALGALPDGPTLPALLNRVAQIQAHDHPELGEHRDDLGRVIAAETERFVEAIARARGTIRRESERRARSGTPFGPEDLVEWYDSLGVTPDVAVEELGGALTVPEDFYARVARRHEEEVLRAHRAPETEADRPPEVPADRPPTEVLYYTDPYTHTFRARVVHATGPWVLLDRTYFYPTGGGQITDTGTLEGIPVVEVLRSGPWVLHRLDRPAPFAVGTTVSAALDLPRRRQLMQHHTATHLLNGALRQVLGPHVWQAGAYKGTDLARIDITHFRSLTREELHEVDRLVNRIVRENRPVRSYFENRAEAERRFGFTLYQGGAVPGREIRIVEIEGFDVEACGGTHCTHTSEVGFVSLLNTERIQDGVVRLVYAAGDRALDLKELYDRSLAEAARKLGVAPEKVPEGVDRLMGEVEEARRTARQGRTQDLKELARNTLIDSARTGTVGTVRIAVLRVALPAAALKELSRELTGTSGVVALLATEEEGRGWLLVGSSAAEVPAREVLAAMLPAIEGRGGGNLVVATGSGRPGAALDHALAAGRDRARALAVGGSPP
ncbi:MAG: alanine--tRNA ligase [Thermoplasmata archaeon]